MKTPIARAFAVIAAVAVLLSWNSSVLVGEVIEKSKGAPVSRAARDTFERLGGRGTPFFLIGGERLHGFSVPIIEHRLRELGISGRSHE